MALQYRTAFSCPECGEHTFETDALVMSAEDFVESPCTGCGHELTREELARQMATLPAASVQKMIADAAALREQLKDR